MLKVIFGWVFAEINALRVPKWTTEQRLRAVKSMQQFERVKLPKGESVHALRVEGRR